MVERKFILVRDSKTRIGRKVLSKQVDYWEIISGDLRRHNIAVTKTKVVKNANVQGNIQSKKIYFFKNIHQL